MFISSYVVLNHDNVTFPDSQFALAWLKLSRSHREKLHTDNLSCGVVPTQFISNRYASRWLHVWIRTDCSEIRHACKMGCEPFRHIQSPVTKKRYGLPFLWASPSPHPMQRSHFNRGESRLSPSLKQVLLLHWLIFQPLRSLIRLNSSH